MPLRLVLHMKEELLHTDLSQLDDLIIPGAENAVDLSAGLDVLNNFVTIL